jgi:hypothetical protein
MREGLTEFVSFGLNNSNIRHCCSHLATQAPKQLLPRHNGSAEVIIHHQQKLIAHPNPLLRQGKGSAALCKLQLGVAAPAKESDFTVSAFTPSGQDRSPAQLQDDMF